MATQNTQAQEINPSSRSPHGLPYRAVALTQVIVPQPQSHPIAPDRTGKYASRSHTELHIPSTINYQPSTRLFDPRASPCARIPFRLHWKHEMLNTKTIRDRLHQTPFTPFRICLSDGRRISVQHPDFVAIGGSVVLVTDRQDNIQRLDSLHIVSLDDVRSKKRNGKH